MDIYLRVAGVNAKGATENLKLLPTEAAMANVTPLYRNTRLLPVGKGRVITG